MKIYAPSSLLSPRTKVSFGAEEFQSLKAELSIKVTFGESH